MGEMSASDNFKSDSIREKFGAHPRDVRSSERNPIELVPSSEKYFIFSKCGVTAAPNRNEVRNAAHEIQILFLKRTHLRQRESFSRCVWLFFLPRSRLSIITTFAKCYPISN
jgi:hypothetical protein